MKYKDAQMLAAKFRELADFFEEHGHKLPSVWHSPRVDIYATATDYKRNPESGEYESTINEEETKRNLKRVLDVFGPCEKEYADSRIEIVKPFACDPERGMLRATVDRSIACKKVVVGQKLRPAAFVQAEMVDVVEWQCDEGLSLLNLVKDI